MKLPLSTYVCMHTNRGMWSCKREKEFQVTDFHKTLWQSCAICGHVKAEIFSITKSVIIWQIHKLVRWVHNKHQLLRNLKWCIMQIVEKCITFSMRQRQKWSKFVNYLLYFLIHLRINPVLRFLLYVSVGCVCEISQDLFCIFVVKVISERRYWGDNKQAFPWTHRKGRSDQCSFQANTKGPSPHPTWIPVCRPCSVMQIG